MQTSVHLPCAAIHREHAGSCRFIKSIAMNCNRAMWVLMLGGLSLLAAGCNEGTSLVRLPIHGTLTLPGGEKLNGSITFLPAGGEAGPAATGDVIEGKYQFNRNNGPTAGPKKVIVKRVVSRKEQMRALAERKPLKIMTYEWDRTAVLSNDGQFLHDFDLKN